MIIEHEWKRREKNTPPEDCRNTWKGYLLKSPVTLKVIAVCSSEKEAKRRREEIRKDPVKRWLFP